MAITSFLTYFPHVNPIVFFKDGTFQNWMDATRHLPGNCYIQKYAINDRLTFQVRIIDEFDRSYLYRSYRLNIFNHDIRTGAVTNVYTEEQQIVDRWHVFSITKRISEITTDTNEFYLRIELRLMDNQIPGFPITLHTVNYESNTLQLITEPEEIQDSKLIRYTNSSDKFDALFSEMPAGFEIRLPALFGQPTPGQSSNIFEGYQRDLELISATPFENINLYIGQDNIGIPDWHLKNINAILCCDYKAIDRVQYELLPEADLTPIKADNYLFGWLDVAMAKAKNEFSLFYQEPFGDSPISITSVNATAQAETYEVIVNSTGDFYLESTNNTFFSFSPTFGYAGQTVITVTVNENLTTDSRTGQITAYLEENPSVFAIGNVVQSGQRILQVTPEELTLPYANGRTGQFNIISNLPWSINYDPAIITLNIASGTGNATITVTGSEYYGRAARNTTLTVMDTGSSTNIDLPINIEGTPTFIDLDSTIPIYINSDETRVEVTGRSNGYKMAFRITSGNGTADPNYIINGTTSVPDGNLVPGDIGRDDRFTFASGFTFPINETENDIQRIVTVFSGNTEVEITIIQRGIGEQPYLNVNPTTINFPYNPEAPQIVEVASNINSSIVPASISEFLTINPQSGGGNWNHEVSVPLLTGRNPRAGGYIIQSEGGSLLQAVTVNQARGPIFITADQREYIVEGFLEDYIVLEVTGTGNRDYFWFGNRDGDIDYSDFIEIPAGFELNGEEISNKSESSFPVGVGENEQYTWKIDLIIPKFNEAGGTRQAPIFIYNENESRIGVFNVVQHGPEPYFIVEPEILEFPADGSESYVTIDTNTTWDIVEVLPGSDWTGEFNWPNNGKFYLNYTKERGVSQIIGISDENTGQMRETSITLRDSQRLIEKAIIVRQLAYEREFTISTYDDFIRLRNAINNRTESELVPEAVNGGGFSGITIRMVNDVDFENRAFPGIGSYTSSTVYRSFNGIFEGEGHSIINFNVSSPTNNSLSGLFIALNNAEIRNFTIRGDINYPNATTRIGLISPFIVGHCKFSNIVNYCNITSGYWVSWVYNENMGPADNRLVEASDCLNFGNFSCVTSLAPYMMTMFGGATTVGVQVTRCANFGNMSVLSNSNSGRCSGIAIGQFLNIDSCYNVGVISGSNAINNNTFACGIAGYHVHVAGGTAAITNCYDLGQVTGSAARIGLITKGAATPNYQNNYHNSDTLTPTTGYDGDPKTTAELQSGILFNSINYIEEQGKYPVIPFKPEEQYNAFEQLGI